MKNNPGKPPKFKTEDEFRTAIENYRKDCEDNKRMPNVAGFCSFNKIDRSVYYDYAKKYPHTKKGFEAFLEDIWVQRLSSTSPTGAIFYLKNAFREDYKDRVETDITSGGKPIPILSNVPNHKRDGKNNSTEEKN